MRKLMLMAILTATIDPVVAQVACPKPVPDQPSGDQIVACLRDIQKLEERLARLPPGITSQELDNRLAQLPKPTKGDPGPPGLPRTAHRVGPSGVVDPDNEDFLDFTVPIAGATQTKIIERSEQFVFCALSSFRTSAKVVETAGYVNCTVSREPNNPHRWQVTLSSYSV